MDADYPAMGVNFARRNTWEGKAHWPSNAKWPKRALGAARIRDKTKEADFGGMVERPDAVEATLGRRTGTVTADKAYGIAKVYAAQSERPSRSGTLLS